MAKKLKLYAVLFRYKTNKPFEGREKVLILLAQEGILILRNFKKQKEGQAVILNKKQMTEEDIKLHYITPAIQDKWGLDRITMETKITSCPYASD